MKGPGKSFLFLLAMLAALPCFAETHAISGLVVQVDRDHHTMTVSCKSVPGYMDAMTMPFDVRTAKELEGIKPGTNIDFILVVNKDSSYAKDIRIHPYENFEAEPAEAQRFAILSKLTNPAAAANALNLQQQVPDFTLTDQAHQKVTFSHLKGKVVVVSFAYVRCPNPAYCFRLTSNVGQVMRRFPDQLGRNLILLTIIIDPVHDQNDAIANYAKLWKADSQTWHFLTGPLPDVQRVARMFGMEFWNDGGFLAHSFHTVVIDREGRLYANLEGNQFTSKQLGDLVQQVIER